MIIWKDLTIKDSSNTVKATPTSSGIQFTKSNGANASITADAFSGASLSLSANSKSVSWNSTYGLTVSSISNFNALATFSQGLKCTGSSNTVLMECQNISLNTTRLSVPALISTGDATIYKKLSVSKATTLSDTLSVSGATSLAQTTISGTLTTSGEVKTTGKIHSLYTSSVPQCYPALIISETHDNDVYIVPLVPPYANCSFTITWTDQNGNKGTITFTSKSNTLRPYNITATLSGGSGNTSIDGGYCGHIDNVKGCSIHLTYTASNGTFQDSGSYTRSKENYNDNEQTHGECILFVDPYITWYPAECTAGVWFRNDAQGFRVISPIEKWASGQSTDESVIHNVRVYFKAIMTLIGDKYINTSNVYIARGGESARRIWTKSGKSGNVVWRCDKAEAELSHGVVYEVFE